MKKKTTQSTFKTEPKKTGKENVYIYIKKKKMTGKFRQVRGQHSI